MTPSRDISRLLDIMARLRNPGSGCPWDLEQDFSSVAPYTIEEAYEVADAIARGDLDDLRDELGDLLLQVVFHARMAEEQNAFSFGDVVEAITRKMIRRHPHVFADASGKLTPADVKGAWDRIKAEEKTERAARRPAEETSRTSLLSSVKAGQPALIRAMELQRKASSVGFDWNDPRAVLHKIREEADEIEAALDHGDADDLAGETGDLLFALVNLARHVGADPEAALRGTNAKFERRFSYIELTLAAQGRSLESASLQEMDALWDEAKGTESPRRPGERRTHNHRWLLLGVLLPRVADTFRITETEGMGPGVRRDDVERVVRITSLLHAGKRHRCPQIPSREWEFQETSLSSIKEGGGTPKGAP